MLGVAEVLGGGRLWVGGVMLYACVRVCVCMSVHVHVRVQRVAMYSVAKLQVNGFVHMMGSRWGELSYLFF